MMNNVALSMIRCGNIATIRNLTVSSIMATVRVLTPKILTISSRQFSVSMPARAVNAATRGHDIEIEVAVFLEETLTEHKRTISYNLPVYNAFGMIEQEIPKTLNEDPGGRRQWSTHPPERPWDAGRKRRSKWRPVAGDSLRHIRCLILSAGSGNSGAG